MRERDLAGQASDGIVDGVCARSTTPPVVRWIEVGDIVDALRLGLADFRAVPTHGLLYGLVYAIAGLVLAQAARDVALLPLIFPLVSGFALVGPFVAVGLYELSRRREQGLPTRWWHAFGVRRHAPARALLVLGALLALLFGLWLWTASLLFDAIVGAAPDDLPAFVAMVLTTEAGWALIIVGHAVGLVFAVVAFAVSAVSFPLLIDRDMSAGAALSTSVRAVVANPLPMGLWAAIIACGLILGSAPLLLGLPIVLPILGHATWHVYRRVVLP